MRKRRPLGVSRSKHKFAAESLESRHLLTSFLSLFEPIVNTFVPQDSEGTVIQQGGVDSFTEPSHGSVAYSADQLVYTPDAGFTGSDSFTVTSHGRKHKLEITVSETVYAVPDWARILPGTTGTLDVLANDYTLRERTPTPHSHGIQLYEPSPSPTWQLQEDELTIIAVEPGENGAVSVANDGTTLTFIPQRGFIGTETIQYTVEDHAGHTSTAQVTIEVSNEPVLVDAYTSAAEFVHDRIDHWMQTYAGRLSYNYFCCQIATSTLDLPFFTSAGSEAFQSSDASGNVMRGNAEIDEGDIVKRNGDLLYVATDREVKIVDLSTPTHPRVTNAIAFENPVVELFVSDSRLVVVTGETTWSHAKHTSTTVHQIDVSDSENPLRLSSTELESEYVDSRIMGDNFYIVSSIEPESLSPRSLVDPELPITSPGIYVDILLEAGAPGFLPQMAIHDGPSTVVTSAFEYQSIDRQQIDQLQTLVTTIDLSRETGMPIDTDAVAGGHASTVHFSTSSIYIAGVHGWTRSANATSDNLVKLDIESDGSGVTFAASGALTGRLVDQFSINEHDGFLRVATTEGRDKVDVHVFEQQGSALEIVGSVEDIAPGEQIYAARFEEDRAFVVTFRVIDPFFVIDLSDPTQPLVQGELKIPGFSNYLHVINDDFVIGVGQNEAWNMQVSLFDVSDSNNPVLVDRYDFEEIGTTSALIAARRGFGDHQAFTYVEETGMLSLPYHHHSSWNLIWSDDLTEPAVESGVRFLHVDFEEGFTLAGDIEFASEALRSIPFDGNMVLMSSSELKVVSPDGSELHAEVSLTDSMQTLVVGTLSLQPPYDPTTDLDGDGVNSPLDALSMINHFNSVGAGPIEAIAARASSAAASHIGRFDINGDGIFNPVDAVLVVNSLQRRPGEPTAMPFAHAQTEETREDYIDRIFAESVA